MTQASLVRTIHSHGRHLWLGRGADLAARPRGTGLPVCAVALVLLAAPASPLAATIDVNSTADTLVAGDGECTLREAINNANDDIETTGGDCPPGSGADLINVPAGNYLVDTSVELYVSSDLAIKGAARASTTLHGIGTGIMFAVEGTGARIENLTVADASVGVSCYVCDIEIRSTSLTGNAWAGAATGGGRLRIQNSTIEGNGAGIMLNAVETFAGPCSAPGRLHLVNSTISRNEIGVSPGFWCGTFNNFLIENSTITANQRYGVWLFAGFTSNVLRNTIVADQLSGTDCATERSGVDSRGHNIDSDGTCGFSDPTDLSNVDPLLGPLQSNGGPTPTHALLLGSPAIDRVPTGACTYDDDGDPATPEIALTRDQRGGSRPRDGDGASPNGCDVGAYEVTACADGRDNDADGLIDFDGGATAGLTPPAGPDPHCASALGLTEAPPPPSGGCGFGPELALLIPTLAWLRRPRGKQARRDG